MAREGLVVDLEDRNRLVFLAEPGEQAAVCLDNALRAGIELVGAVETLLRFLAVVRLIENESGMEVLEQGVPVGAGELVDRLDRRARFVGANEAPCGQKGGGQIGHRPPDRLGDMLARGRILLLLERADADHKTGDALVAIALQDAVAEAGGLLDVAFGKNGYESAIEQFAVLGVGAQGGAVIGGRCGGIALGAGVTGGEIIARWRDA